MNAITTFLVVFSIGVLCPFSAYAQSKCIEATTTQLTYSGSNELITYVDRKEYQMIKGQVFDLDLRPLNNALIEVFDSPEWITSNQTKPDLKQKRLAACTTPKSGVFEFPRFTSGDFELRVSKEGRWEVYHIYVRISPKKQMKKDEKLTIHLRPAT